MKTQIGRFAIALVTVAVLGTTAASGVAMATGLSAHAATHHRKHHRRHHSRIPQRGGGDHDADNNGGPSDGDGNI